MTEYNIINDASFIEASLHKISKDIIKYAPSKIVGMLASLLLVPLYTNLLSPEQYGLYNVAIAALSFLCIIFSDWIGLSALRFFKEHQSLSNIKSYFATLIFLLISNLAVLYVFGFLSFNSIISFFKIPSNLLFIVLLLIIPVAVRALLFQVLRAQIQPISYTISVIFNQLTAIAFAVYFIHYWHLGAKALLLGMAISIGITDLIMILQSKMHKTVEIKEVKFAILNNFYRYGIPIAFSSLGMWIISQSNRFVIQYFKGSYYNGILGVGYNLTFSIIMPLFAIITLAAIPRIFERYEAGEDTNPIITKLTGYYFLIFLPVIFILCFFPKEIVALFSNKQYAEAQIIIPFLALSMFAFGLAEYTTIQYHLAKKTYLDTIIRLIPGILGLILSIILVPKSGLLGVGISTLISYGLYLILSIVIKVKNLGWQPPYKETRTSSIALFACFISYWGLKFGQKYFTNSALQVIVIILIYVMVLKLQYNKKKMIY